MAPADPVPSTRDSPNWWPLAKTIPYCREQVGNRDLADLVFAAAVNDGRLPTKIEQFNRRTGERATSLFSPEMRCKYELGPFYYGAWVFQPHAPDIPPITPPYALYFWAPVVMALWPPLSSVPPPSSEPVKPAVDDVPVAGKSDRPPPPNGRAWPTLLALMRKHPAPTGLRQSYPQWLAEKQDSKDGKPISWKTFANLMPDAKREIARERARKPFPRERLPEIVSRGKTPGKSGKA